MESGVEAGPEQFETKAIFLHAFCKPGQKTAARAVPSVQLIFAIAVCMQAVNAFHRPAMDALSQKLVEPADYGAIGALSSLRHSVAAILGPAIGGILIAWGGVQVAFWVDCATFMCSVVLLALMQPTPPAVPDGSGHWQMIVDGVNFARSRPELIGTYLVDICPHCRCAGQPPKIPWKA